MAGGGWMAARGDDAISLSHRPDPVAAQVALFPSTRLMGSKEQLLDPLWEAIGRSRPARVLDLCSGSGVVSYMLAAQGCAVVANDQMAMANVIAEALVANGNERLSDAEVEAIAAAPGVTEGMVWALYGELYFGREDVAFLDAARLSVAALPGAKRALALAALIRACVKRRARGIFTYTGQRYDDGRQDLKRSLRDHFRTAAAQLNAAVFDNGQVSRVTRVDLSAELPEAEVDLVYLDPPYFSPLADNNYVRRYHFVEALARDWVDVDIQYETRTRKLRNYPNPFRSEAACVATVERVLDGYRDVPMVMSYSSNALPGAATLLALMRRHGRKAAAVAVDHRYSFANQAAARSPVRNKVRELIFIAE